MKKHAFRLLAIIFASITTFCEGFSFITGSGVLMCQPPTSGTGNLFGFSLASHILPDGDNVLIVGAPKEKIGMNREGTAYSCKPQGNLNCDCSQLNVGEPNGVLGTINTDPQVIGGGAFVYDDLAQFEEAKNGSLMGFSVTSNSEAGQAAACAPLQRVDGYPFGSCVGLTQNLSETLYRAYTSYGGEDAILAGGASVKLRKDSSNSYRIIAGAPLSNRKTNRLSVGSVDQIPYTNTNFSFGSKKIGLEGNEDILRVGSISSYVGYAVDYGYFTQPSTMASQQDILASAPRYNNHKGGVFAFTESSSPAESIGTLTPVLIASGDSIGSYFGYDILVVNFDPSDGCDDLIVGSPLYSTFSPLSPDRGRITVFKGEASGGVCTLSKAVTHEGESYEKLGSSITNLGDVNFDGIPDIGVAGMNSSKIYVFLGKRSGKITLSQHVETADYGFSGIYTLLGGVDFNLDKYPDIVFGDPTLERVEILAGSPLVRVDAELEFFTNDGQVLAPGDELAVTNPMCESTIEGAGIKVLCFKVRPCFNMSLVQPGQLRSFKIDYSIDLDRGQDGARRVYFIGAGKQSRLEGMIELMVDQRMCSAEMYTAYFESNFGDLSPVNLTLDIEEVPSDIQNTISNDAMFVTIVPALDRTNQILNQEGLTSRILSLSHPCSDGICNVDLKLGFQRLPTINISEEIFTMVVYVSNDENDVALQTFFTAIFPENIEVVQRQLNASNELSGANCTQTSRDQFCSLQPNPFMSTRVTGPVFITYTLKFRFEFPLNLNSLSFYFQIDSPKSSDSNPNNNQLSPRIELDSTTDIFFQIRSGTNRFTLREAEDGSYASTNIELTFRVGNYGPTWINPSTMRMDIFWPLCVHGFCDVNSQKNILIESPTINAQAYTCMSPKNLSQIQADRNNDEISENDPSFEAFQLCNKTSICTRIVCIVQLLRADTNSFITLSSRMNLGPELDIPNSIVIQPSANLETPLVPSINLRKIGKFDSLTISQNLFIFPQATLDQCIMIFPIVAGIMAGFAFIFIIGLIIWLIQFTGKERYVLVKRRKKKEGSRSNTPSTTGQFQLRQDGSPSHGVESTNV